MINTEHKVFRYAQDDRGWVGTQRSHHPIFIPLFCSSSHFFSGAKYSRIALASPSRCPVNTSIASGQGLLTPIWSILLSFVPASLDPKKVQRFSEPLYPASRHNARSN